MKAPKNTEDSGPAPVGDKRVETIMQGSGPKNLPIGRSDTSKVYGTNPFDI